MNPNRHRKAFSTQPCADMKAACSIKIVTLSAFSLLVLLAGCRSAPPPPPKPVPVQKATRATEQAARLTEQRNWPAAARQWEAAVSHYRLLNDRRNEAIALHNLAQAERALGRHAEALDHLDQAADLNRQIGNSSEWWRNQIALTQIEIEVPELAEAAAARIARLDARLSEVADPNLRAMFLNELAVWQIDQREFGAAADALSEAEQAFASAGNEHGLAVVIGNRARLHEAQSNWPEALRTWQAALARFEEQADLAGIAAGLAGHGRALLGLEDFAAAENYLRRAVFNFRALDMPERLIQALEALVESLEAQEKFPEAEKVMAELQRERERAPQPDADPQDPSGT
jgi:tetratricopeptide (TPR) repeat protein